jgi:hypothetical protein
MKIDFADMSPNYYGQVDGIMLEEFPAMNEVLQRLANLSPEEQKAWGKLFLAWGNALIVRNEPIDG